MKKNYLFNNKNILYYNDNSIFSKSFLITCAEKYIHNVLYKILTYLYLHLFLNLFLIKI